MNFKSLIDDVISKSQLDQLPQELQPARVFIWNTNINPKMDWDDFISGQFVAHAFLDGTVNEQMSPNDAGIPAMIDLTNLTFGNSSASFWGALKHQEQVTIYTSKFFDIDGKIISLNDDIKSFYIALSFELQNFTFDKDKKQKLYAGKVVLVNLQKWLDNQFNDSDEAPIINITQGMAGMASMVPVKKEKADKLETQKYKLQGDGQEFHAYNQAQVFYSKPAVFIGGGHSFVLTSGDRLNTNPTQYKRWIISDASTTPSNYPHQHHYSILPTQWQIPSVDNYGMTHPADRSNFIKTLLATQAIGQAAAIGQNIGGSVLGKVEGGIANASFGLAQKFLGDKGTLANSTAITASHPTSDADPLKFFIQAETAGNSRNSQANGDLMLDNIANQNDYLEINQANGIFGKYGKSMSPSQNNQFDSFGYWRALGLKAINNRPTKTTYLATPYTPSKWNQLKTTDEKIKQILKQEFPRLKINDQSALAPMPFPETWPVYIRNMFFRPDPYSFWNWPCLMPAEVGVYDVEKQTDLAFDTSLNFGELFDLIGAQNDTDNKNKKLSGWWNKTITIGQLTNNELYDPNKTFSSFSFSFSSRTPKIHQLHIMAFTASTVDVTLIGQNLKNGARIEKNYKFNTQGANAGTAANWGTVIQF